MLELEKKYLAMQELPTNPDHPMFYHIFSKTLPIEQAYRNIDPRK